jgi:hypothetical protein
MSLDTQLTDYYQQTEREKRGAVLRLSKDMAKRFLSDAEQDKVFWLSDGRQLKNLAELKAALDGMSDEVFSSHVNKDKNDFSSWIAAVIGDVRLAADLKRSRTLASVQAKIEKRLLQLSSK